MLINYLGILTGLILLVYGAHLFVDGAANIARRLGLSPLIIGMTIVGIATSAPEILVGTVAALNGRTEIAIGNAIGSNIANIGLVLGFTILIMPVTINTKTLKKEFFIMISAILLAMLLMLDQNLNHIDATILLTALVATIILMVHLARRFPAVIPAVTEPEVGGTQQVSIGRSLLLFFIGLLLLLGGAHLLVECSVIVARHYGLSDLIIGLTIVAVGTSMPELAASIVAAKKNQASIAIGNIIGSNIFNMLAVIGIPVMIHASDFDRQVLFRDFPVMIGFSLLMAWMIFVHSPNRFGRLEGAILFLGFIAYQYSLI